MSVSHDPDASAARAAGPGRETSSAFGRPDSSISIATELSSITAEIAVLKDARRRMHQPMAGNDRRSGLLTGGSFLVAIVAWNVLAPPSSPSIGAFAACVAVYVIAGSVEFEIGPGSALPTTPVQLLMLFLLPPQLVPVAVLCGLGGAALVGRLRDPERRERPIVLAGSGWQVVGPAAVFAFAHVHHPVLADLPVYVLALIAQFTLDAASSWVRNCYGLRLRTKDLFDALKFTFGCDLLLAPIGLAAALAVPDSPGALLFLLPLMGLLAMLESNRRTQIDKTIVLGAAFADTSDLARHDVLTGLSNRLAWEEATARYEDFDAPVGIVLADVDGLKAANDRYGHDMGDQLLVAVANIIANAAAESSSAIAARIGGDEFALLLPFASPASTLALDSALKEAFAAPTNLNGIVPVSASVGVGFTPTGRTLGTAIAAADRRVQTNKEARGLRRT